jgi:hypothetical protein
VNARTITFLIGIPVAALKVPRSRDFNFNGTVQMEDVVELERVTLIIKVDLRQLPAKHIPLREEWEHKGYEQVRTTINSTASMAIRTVIIAEGNAC